MNTWDASRRQFLIGSATGLSSAWLRSKWPAVLSAQQLAERAARSSPNSFHFFSPEDAVEVEAIAAQVIPRDDTPGAREAHVIHFIDQVLVAFDREKQPTYIAGLRDLQLSTRKRFLGVDKFSNLSVPQQIQLLNTIEKTQFFEVVRVHTVMGFLANPQYGGNYDQAGWKLIGFDDRMSHQPPFGYYDGEFQKHGQ